MSYENRPLVFTDFHHASLLYSLIILFEKRLGGRVYRPIGMEWATEGYWKVYDHPATQLQYLTTDQGYKPADGTDPLNIFTKVKDPEPGVYYCQDIDSGYYNRAISLDKFFELPIDIVIASLPSHIEPFKKLCELHPNKPKLIFQIGNAWTTEAGLAPNVMASATIHNVPPEINFISYHQEFNLDIFKPDPDLVQKKNIFSFVNCFNVAGHFAGDWSLFLQVENLMHEWNFKSFGGQCRDGAAHGSEELADSLRKSKFVWHTKAGGDGYGHIIYNAASVGTPLITKKSYYADKMGAELMIDGVTCLDIDGLSPYQVKEKIEFYSDPDRYKQMRFNVYDNFKRVVNFDVEEIYLRKFLQDLK